MKFSEDVKKKNPHLFNKGIVKITISKPDEMESDAERTVYQMLLSKEPELLLHCKKKTSGITFLIPGGMYTPDFVTVENGVMNVYEAKGVIQTKKGILRNRSYTESRQRWRSAKATNLWAKFWWVEVTNGKTEIKGD